MTEMQHLSQEGTDWTSLEAQPSHEIHLCEVVTLKEQCTLAQINETMMLDRRHDRIVHVALRKNAQFVYQNMRVFVFPCFCETNTQIN